MSAWRRRLPWAIWTVVLAGFAFSWSPIGHFRADNYSQTVIANGLAVSIIFLSFVVVTGMGGMVSLAQATFVTAGGFAAGWALTWHWPNIPVISPHGSVNWILAVIVGGIIAAIVGAIVRLAADAARWGQPGVGDVGVRVRRLAGDLPAANHRQR